MKLYTLTGKQSSVNRNYVEILTTSGNLTFALWPINLFFPPPEWFAQFTRVDCFCVFDSADVNESAPIIVNLYPRTRGFHEEFTNTQTQFILGKTVSVDRNGVMTFGVSENAQNSLMGESAKGILNELRDAVLLLNDITTKQDIFLQGIATALSLPYTPNAPDLLEQLSTLNALANKIEGVLSSNIKFD